MKQQPKTKVTLTFTDPDVLKVLLELQQRFPNKVARSMGHNMKKHGIHQYFNMCTDYEVDMKENQLAAQRAAYQINKQSIKDQNCLKRIVKTHGIEFVKKHT